MEEHARWWEPDTKARWIPLMPRRWGAGLWRSLLGQQGGAVEFWARNCRRKGTCRMKVWRVLPMSGSLPLRRNLTYLSQLARPPYPSLLRATRWVLTLNLADGDDPADATVRWIAYVSGWQRLWRIFLLFVAEWQRSGGFVNLAGTHLLANTPVLVISPALTS